MRTVTPRAIAYIAVQVRSTSISDDFRSELRSLIKLRFALSSSSAWRDVDIDFSHAEFYHAIVDCFEVTRGPVAQARVDDLLAWWNRLVFLPSYEHDWLNLSVIRKIFGRAVGFTQGSHRRGGASVSKLAVQHKAREAVASDS